jgi:hypothetical protein
MKASTTARTVTAAGLVFGSLLALGVGAQAADAPALEADRARFEAQVKGDVAALDKLLATDLTYVHSSGVVETKDEFVGAIRSGKYKYKSIVPEGVTVRAHGDTAVVHGKATIDVVSSGRDVHVLLVFTDVWVKRDGRWQMVSWHSTRLDP